ncbi:transporter substrate-binding domain-containing protein [Pseudomonas sp. nanlin1]|uniref:transporter substrate-binding domain-containing protein n=1 Tax=Pseudomonas sp. nanlin1 TaxID=3040605 RepID=UPI0038902F3F
MQQRTLRIVAWLALPWLGIGLALADTSVADHYALLGRTTFSHLRVELSPEQEQWLQQRQALVIGTSAPDYPPFDLTFSGRDYEGLTPDYADLIGRALGLSVKVARFEDREAAIQALVDGEIDLLGSANGFEAASAQLLLTQPYAVDRPVLVSRSDETRALDGALDDLRLSMVYHYLPEAEVKATYPGASVTLYPSFQSALNAVAFGQADVFLGDAISTHYLIEKGYLNNIRMARFGQHQAVGFGFAANQGNAQLISIIDRVLQAIPPSVRDNILKRWSAGSGPLLTDRSLQLSEREERWLAQHPVLRVVVDESLAPLSFFDADNRFRGISADVLELVRLRIGVDFQIQRAAGLGNLIEQIDKGEADLVAAISPSEERQDQLDFSRPFVSNSPVLLSRSGPDSPRSLQQMAGLRLGITRGDPLEEYLRQRYPDIELVETEDSFSALDLLAQGQTDGAVNSLMIANYFLASQLFKDKLVIRATIGSEPATFALATARHTSELSAILDKALLSIAPQELEAINSRWRGYSPPPDTYWRNYHRLIRQIITGASVLLLMSSAWIFYMRRQIRHRVQAERALSDQVEFMGALINGTPHPIYVRNRQGVLLSCNESYLQTFNARRDDVIGKDVLQGALPCMEQSRTFDQDYQQVMREGTPLIMDRPLRIGAREFTIYHWILPFHDSLGEVRGIIGGWIDISERRQLLEDLRAAKDQADAANRAKSTFLATMSHEIRTPMNAVIGMLELALKRADQGLPDRAAIEVAHDSARGLLDLIGDILDIARIESGRLSLCPERVRLHELIESVVRVFDGLARQKNLNLMLALAPAADRDVLVDPLRLKQILSNLISNAIKFTQQGCITISIEAQPLGNGERLQVKLQVEDTGIGISAADQARLFKPFAQIGSAAQPGHGGAGLGLVISRSLCDMMGASMSLFSEPGKGTRIAVETTLTCLEALPATSTPAQCLPPIAQLDVLVVDDHPANRLLMTQQLEYLGLCPVTANDGVAGLDAWRQEPFDLLIVDCNMPHMNGYDLARAVRQEEAQRLREPCVILGYTANAQPEEREACQRAGMNDCLFKPVSLAELGAHLSRVKKTTPRMHDILAVEALSQLTGNDSTLIRRLLEEVQRGCDEDRAALAAMPRDDANGLALLAHKIKGAARIVRAHAVSSACEVLEAACLQADSVHDIEFAQQNVLQALDDLAHALHRHLGDP